MRWRMLVLVAFWLAPFQLSAAIAGKYTKAGGDIIEVRTDHAGKVSLEMSGNYGMNTCHVETGPLQLEDHQAEYSDPDDKTCHIRVRFRGKTARLDQQGQCGCGLNVNLSGTYQKQLKMGTRAKPGNQSH